MNIGLPLPHFESEGLEDGNRQHHEGTADDSDADGFLMTFVHTANKGKEKKWKVKSEKNLLPFVTICSFHPTFMPVYHKPVQNIPEIWRASFYLISLQRY